MGAKEGLKAVGKHLAKEGLAAAGEEVGKRATSAVKSEAIDLAGRATEAITGSRAYGDNVRAGLEIADRAYSTAKAGRSALKSARSLRQLERIRRNSPGSKRIAAAAYERSKKVVDKVESFRDGVTDLADGPGGNPGGQSDQGRQP